MRKVLIQTAEPVSSREATERLVKILDITYAKSYLKQISDNSNHMNPEKNSNTKAPQIF